MLKENSKQCIVAVSAAALLFIAYHSVVNKNNEAMTSNDQLVRRRLQSKSSEPFVCPFAPPLEEESSGISDWGGWKYDLPSIKAFHIRESAHTGIYKFLGPGKSLVDIGAGVGQMKVALDLIGADIDYVGFDGGYNIMELEGKNTPVFGDDTHVVPHLCWVDASKPFYLAQTFDAVLSKEVGEHIPAAGEAAFMDNLVRLAKPHGGLIILTWAHPGQGGNGHVNCKEKKDIIERMERRGVKHEPIMTQALGATIASAYAENLMVFSKP